VNKFVPVDRGHHDIADYEIGIFSLRDGQAFCPSASLKRAIAMGSQQGSVQPPAGPSSSMIRILGIVGAHFCCEPDSQRISRMENRFNFQEGDEASGAALPPKRRRT